MAKIFISYSRPDREFAARLSERLKAIGYSVFYDFELLSGDAWDRRIEAELAGSSAVVVLWSDVSVERTWVRNEARYALNNSILFPATIRKCEIPLEFNHIQSEDLTGWNVSDEPTGLNRLIAAINSRLDSPYYSLTEGVLPEPISRYKLGSFGFIENGSEIPHDLFEFEARADQIGFDDEFRRRYLSAMKHNLELFVQLQIPKELDSLDRYEIDNARSIELNATEAAIAARFRVETRQLQGDTINFSWVGLAPIEGMPRSGRYTGGLQNGVPHGFGRFTTDNLEKDQYGLNNGEDFSFVGDWINGRFSGLGIFARYSHYEGMERYVEVVFGSWLDGIRHGFGLSAGESMTWSMDALPFMTFSRHHAGTEAHARVEYIPRNGENVHQCLDLERIDYGFASGKKILPLLQHESCPNGSKMPVWSRNTHIFDGIGETSYRQRY